MTIEQLKEKVIHDFPETPGVYTMYGPSSRRPALRRRLWRGESELRPREGGGKGEVLYIGKAGNLRRRVSSYFLRAPSFAKATAGKHDARIEKLLQEVREIVYEETDTALEALILESKLIKEKHPTYNIREQDDKSFLYVAITRETFPRVLLVRGKEKDSVMGKLFGPFTSGASIREAMRILRRIFPWSTHRLEGEKVERLEGKRPCFDYEVGLCPGTCIEAIGKSEYRKSIRRLVDVFEGKKKRVLSGLVREMAQASRALEFEKAAKLRKQIFALQHIQDIALISDQEVFVKPYTLNPTPYRIEGYDISNISGTSAVGAMVVFRGAVPDKNEYRKFRIKTIAQSDDVGMIKEVLRRRFKNSWTLPNLILIDGGRGQVNAAREVLGEAGLKIPLVGIAKGPERKKNEFIGKIPEGVSAETLIRVRDEAHRFAIAYHKRVRSKAFLGR